LIRQDVYARADAGEGRDRFTMCHELGHLILHRDLALSRVDPSRPSKLYCNSEWQADKFASFLLMPRSLVEGIALRDAQEVFGVSLDAARARSQEMKNA
jgi:Zn-dependent peptidase ImmA (M78 family)